MNKYEEWLSIQPVVRTSFGEMVVSYYQRLDWVVEMPAPSIPNERLVSRSVARQEREREQNICPHRAFLGYGQGRSRRQ